MPRKWLWSLAAVMAFAAFGGTVQADEELIAIKAGLLIDGTAGRPLEDVVITSQGDRITNRPWGHRRRGRRGRLRTSGAECATAAPAVPPRLTEPWHMCPVVCPVACQRTAPAPRPGSCRTNRRTPWSG